MAARASGNQHVRTVCGSHQQRTGTEVLQHVRNAACAESDGFNAASIDVAFVDDGRIQVASHIDRTSRDQVKAPRHRAENRQRAGFCSFAGSTLFTLALEESSKISDRSGRVRPCSSTGAFSLLTITPVMLVFWHRRSCCGSVRYALSAVPGCQCPET